MNSVLKMTNSVEEAQTIVEQVAKYCELQYMQIC